MTKQKILIIDSDAYFSNSVKLHLTNEGFDVMVVHSKEDGLKEMRAKKPALVLFDLTLPVASGLSMLKEKNKDKTIAKIPVVMISELNDPATIDEALGLGIDDYLIKSNLDQHELIEKIRLQLEVPGTQENFDGEKEEGKGTLSGNKILWVEDDIYLTDIISRKLALQGCTFIHAKTGEEALQIVEKEMPDIMMLDILLPGIDGFQILEKMKKDEKLKHIPVVLTSNLGQKSDIEKGESLGADKFLVKATVTLDEIIEEMKRILTRTKKK